MPVAALDRRQDGRRYVVTGDIPRAETDDGQPLPTADADARLLGVHTVIV